MVVPAPKLMEASMKIVKVGGVWMANEEAKKEVEQASEAMKKAPIVRTSRKSGRFLAR